MRGSQNRKEGREESLKGEVSFFCVSLSGPKGRRSPVLVLLVLVLIRTGLGSKGSGPQSPQEAVCSWELAGQGAGRGMLGQKTSWGVFCTSVLTHVYIIYIQPCCLELYCFGDARL